MVHPKDLSTAIDLTTMVSKETDFSVTEGILLVTTGGVGYLAKKAFEYFFPRPATIEEQVENLTKFLRVGRESGVKKMKFKMNSSAGIQLALGGTKYKVIANNENVTEFEVEFK
jgi:hypothetical protein